MAFAIGFSLKAVCQMMSDAASPKEPTKTMPSAVLTLDCQILFSIGTLSHALIAADHPIALFREDDLPQLIVARAKRART